MTLSPIILFVYRRPVHTAACLRSLRHNALASRSDLVVFSDAPADETVREAASAVREVVRGARGFASMRIVEREHHMGLAASVIAGVSEVISERGRVIVLEDDLIVSPHFLSFMNTALERYEPVGEVFSISGYNLPPTMMHVPRSYAADVYFNPRSASWGWGTWANRWDKADWDVTVFPRLMQDTAMQRQLGRVGEDLLPMLMAQQAGRIDSWSIRWTLTHFLNGAVALYPVRSHVANTGLDGSGVHSGRSDSDLGIDLSRANPNCTFPQQVTVDANLLRPFRRYYGVGARHHIARMFRRFGAGVVRARPQSRLRTTHVTRSAPEGGAGRAAHRLVKGLNACGGAARLLVSVGSPNEEFVGGRESLLGKVHARLHTMIDVAPLRLGRIPVEGPWSVGWFPSGITADLMGDSPDIVHLHWPALGQLAIADLPRIGVPIVWTLHDMWPFTGGCHYDADCGRYVERCGRCPQLDSRVGEDISRLTWRWKRRCWSGLDLTIVAPSRWLADCARRSSLLRNSRIEVIPNGLDLRIHRPIDKAQARRIIGLPEGRPLIAFGAANPLGDQRKGFRYLERALWLCAQSLPTAELLVFGGARSTATPKLAMPVHHIGNLGDELSIALACSSADVMVVPSTQDNLPNIVLEAMACGTPIVAFNVGGIRDMVEHDTTGYLAHPKDERDLARGITLLLTDGERLRHMSSQCRLRVEERCDILSVAKRYAALYEHILVEKYGGSSPRRP